MPRLVTGWIFPEVITEVSDGCHTKSVENDFAGAESAGNPKLRKECERVGPRPTVAFVSGASA